jgi:hypothetical protein
VKLPRVSAAVGRCYLRRGADLPQAGAAGSPRPITGPGGLPTGAAIVEALLKDVEPAVNRLAKPGEANAIAQLLRPDRNLLELMAARGRNMTAYVNRKRELGLS